MSAIYYFVLAGLCEGVKLDVFYPGFPTMYHVAHKVLMHFLLWQNLNLVIGLSLRFRLRCGVFNKRLKKIKKLRLRFTFRMHFLVGYHSRLLN